ncbi:hypothetical protein AGABI2DRAFT_210750 [Agaricus bisporus var. bisporus H97]|uniref:hypothetical protein n=1 Tax=Agaricus bisporus var. bisporus (strain H97 / ATCC MYA-4626 / FGSC 10389) TaxID=936046 RepID=UPI00029F6CA2|nr:hypothetical protein AGABI2DRAFT_210750 [Agaricus bisporus var. bisporus H97]EKV43050.1 hypothetical protein AGABI2DRAFT_210750 [Agaricus bisporus var. bisporus H97]
MVTTPDKPSRWIPGRYPEPGTSAIADAIRRRRGERGLTALDGALLHVEPVAEGWNTLLGAVRTKGNVPGDVRELMILRVAAINGAAFEWIHHEIVGRQTGLTTAQLYVIRDISAPLLSPGGGGGSTILSPLQNAALVFADESTRDVCVSVKVTESLREELKKWVGMNDKEEVEKKMDDLFVECALIVASYNMVSRFLVSVDVAGKRDEDVPWPLTHTEEFITLPTTENPTHKIHTVTLKTSDSDSAPWIVFANSLLTDFKLWSLVVPYLISKSYNILLLSQRGHGKSTLPPSSSHPTVTIPFLASDIHTILHHLKIPTPIKSLIGVSQGGATTLAFAAQFPQEVESIVVCDTAACTPMGNNVAWEERIRLVNGDQLGGMKRLADVTVPRWFPSGSKVSSSSTTTEEKGGGRRSRGEWISNMIKETSVEGFEAGARALSSYDTLSLGLFDRPIKHILLLAGSLDGNGKVGSSMKKLSEDWNEKRLEGRNLREVEFVLVEGSGHLPMVDEPEAFCEAVDRFLRSF